MWDIVVFHTHTHTLSNSYAIIFRAHPGQCPILLENKQTMVGFLQKFGTHGSEHKLVLHVPYLNIVSLFLSISNCCYIALQVVHTVL